MARLPGTFSLGATIALSASLSNLSSSAGSKQRLEQWHVFGVHPETW